MEILIFFAICLGIVSLFVLSSRGKAIRLKEEAADKARRERNRKDKDKFLKQEKENQKNSVINKDEEEKKAKLKKDLELINSVYLEKEIEQQKLIEEQNKIKEEEEKKVKQKKIEELRKLNFEEVKKKKEKLENEIELTYKALDKDILIKEDVVDKKNYVNNVDILSITDFENKIKNAIPFHQLSSPPAIGNIEGSFFECGCGIKHKMHFNKHLFLADMGMFKAVFLSIECEYINALKYKSVFSNDIENLFSTKWLKNENKFGFTKSDMMLGGGMPVAINMMLSQAI